MAACPSAALTAQADTADGALPSKHHGTHVPLGRFKGRSRGEASGVGLQAGP
jgi:hypothetical protein